MKDFFSFNTPAVSYNMSIHSLQAVLVVLGPAGPNIALHIADKASPPPLQPLGTGLF
jgi:hypothetical protein